MEKYEFLNIIKSEFLYNEKKSKNPITQYVNIYLLKKINTNSKELNYLNENESDNYNFFDRRNLFIFLEKKELYINLRNFNYGKFTEINDNDNNENKEESFVKFIFYKDPDVDVNSKELDLELKINVLIFFDEKYYMEFINNESNNEFLKAIIVRFIK